MVDESPLTSSQHAGDLLNEQLNLVNKILENDENNSSYDVGNRMKNFDQFKNVQNSGIQLLVTPKQPQIKLSNRNSETAENLGEISHNYNGNRRSENGNRSKIMQIFQSLATPRQSGLAIQTVAAQSAEDPVITNEEVPCFFDRTPNFGEHAKLGRHSKQISPTFNEQREILNENINGGNNNLNCLENFKRNEHDANRSGQTARSSTPVCEENEHVLSGPVEASDQAWSTRKQGTVIDSLPQLLVHKAQNREFDDSEVTENENFCFGVNINDSKVDSIDDDNFETVNSPDSREILSPEAKDPLLFSWTIGSKIISSDDSLETDNAIVQFNSIQLMGECQAEPKKSFPVEPQAPISVIIEDDACATHEVGLGKTKSNTYSMDIKHSKLNNSSDSDNLFPVVDPEVAEKMYQNLHSSSETLKEESHPKSMLEEAHSSSQTLREESHPKSMLEEVPKKQKFSSDNLEPNDQKEFVSSNLCQLPRPKLFSDMKFRKRSLDVQGIGDSPVNIINLPDALFPERVSEKKSPAYCKSPAVHKVPQAEKDDSKYEIQNCPKIQTVEQGTDIQYKPGVYIYTGNELQQTPLAGSYVGGPVMLSPHLQCPHAPPSYFAGPQNYKQHQAALTRPNQSPRFYMPNRYFNHGPSELFPRIPNYGQRINYFNAHHFNYPLLMQQPAIFAPLNFDDDRAQYYNCDFFDSSNPMPVFHEPHPHTLSMMSCHYDGMNNMYRLWHR